jgi:hypothetical protein
MPKIFTRAEAQAALPEIAPLLRALQAQWPELVEATTAEVLLRQRMGSDGHALLGELAALTRRVEAARADASRLIDHVRAYGVVLQDPATGLIDFPCELFGRVVFLCWRLGEGRIAWWHELDAGFAGRQPLDPHEEE